MKIYSDSRHPWVTMLALGLSLTTSPACRSDQQSATSSQPAHRTAPDKSPVVATIGTREITVADVTAELERAIPVVQMRFGTAERKKALLDTMVNLELLAHEAERRGLDRDPRVLRRTKRAMVDELVKQLGHELVQLGDISDTAARAHYDAHRSEYGQPFEQVKQRITNTLFETKRAEALERYVAKLRRRAKVEVLEKQLAAIAPPSAPASAPAPTKGNPDAQ